MHATDTISGRLHVVHGRYEASLMWEDLRRLDMVKAQRERKTCVMAGHHVSVCVHWGHAAKQRVEDPTMACPPLVLKRKERWGQPWHIRTQRPRARNGRWQGILLRKRAPKSKNGRGNPALLCCRITEPQSRSTSGLQMACKCVFCVQMPTSVSYMYRRCIASVSQVYHNPLATLSQVDN